MTTVPTTMVPGLRVQGSIEGRMAAAERFARLEDELAYLLANVDGGVARPAKRSWSSSGSWRVSPQNRVRLTTIA